MGAGLTNDVPLELTGKVEAGCLTENAGDPLVLNGYVTVKSGQYTDFNPGSWKIAEIRRNSNNFWFNIAANISQDKDFNAMLGFTTEETFAIYRDFRGVGKYVDGDPEAIVKSIKPWYDGYCFSSEKLGRESVFNSDMALYYLQALVYDGRPPKNMLDVNIRTDYDKLQAIADIQKQIVNKSTSFSILCCNHVC